MRTPEQVILKALNFKLKSVKDNLARTKMQSQRLPKDEEYDQSGQTLRQILGGLIERKEEVENAIRWTNTL